MRLFDYMISSEKDKEKWLTSFQITSGLRYFGGKQVIGRYIMNHICNMAVRMYNTNKTMPNIFIDAFTGGGKLGLSVPEGWFDTIVMNDLNYGVYSYFKACKETPTALVRMIEEIGKEYNEEMFKFFTLNRSNGKQLKKAGTEADELIENKDAPKKKREFCVINREFINDVELDEIVAGAMTYWVTQTTWNGDTEPSTATYRYKVADNKEKSLSITYEKEQIERAVKFAQKHVFKVHRLMKRKNIIIENLDYKELIKKYNGLKYTDLSMKEHEAIEGLADKGKLWYFDPPYHPATLNGGDSAPYEDTFAIENVQEMTKILHNEDIATYGELKYFIKSDYDPKYTYKQVEETLRIAREKSKGSEEDKKTIKKLERQLEGLKEAYHDFDVLEENIPESKSYKPKKEEQQYKKTIIGTFSKGGEGDRTKTKGTEFIWYRG